MKILIPVLAAFVTAVAAPALATEQHRGGAGCGGGCGGGHPGPGHGGATNINVSVANAYASASAYAAASGVVSARGYDVGGFGGRGVVHGGVVSTGGDYGYGAVGGYGYGHGIGGYGPVVVTGPGYGPSRPYGYVVRGFGRHYTTTDRCDRRCAGPARHDVHGYDSDRAGGSYAYGYSDRYASGASYSVREDFRAEEAYVEGYVEERYENAPRYAPIPYHAAPLEPVPYEAYAPPPIYDTPVGPEPAYVEPYRPEQPPLGYYGDLPPGDDGEGLPYRQEPGERG